MSNKVEKMFNRNGAFCDVLCYASLFDTDVTPSTFGKEIYFDGEDTRFCMKTMTYEYLSEIFNNYEVVVNEAENYYEPNSASSTKERVVTYEGGCTPRGYIDASRLLIDHYNHAVITIGLKGVGIVYNPTKIKDIRGYAKNIYEKLPTTSETLYDDSTPYVGLVTFSNGRYELDDAEIRTVHLDIDKSYNDDFKPIYDDIVKFLDKDNRKSGVVLLNGDPGTGKTFFIRHLVNTVKGNYVIVPAVLARHLDSPEMITFLASNRDSIFILEDCEDIIKSRDNAIFSGISSILNMSDGLMSDIFNGKFICTFNCDIGAIDNALLRKGRCAAMYTFNKLNKTKAKALLTELGKDVDVKDDMSHAEIYNYDDVNVEGYKKQQKVGF